MKVQQQQPVDVPQAPPIQKAEPKLPDGRTVHVADKRARPAERKPVELNSNEKEVGNWRLPNTKADVQILQELEALAEKLKQTKMILRTASCGVYSL